MSSPPLLPLVIASAVTTWWYGGPPAPVKPTPSALSRDFPVRVSDHEVVPSGAEVEVRVKSALLYLLEFGLSAGTGAVVLLGPLSSRIVWAP